MWTTKNKEAYIYNNEETAEISETHHKESRPREINIHKTRDAGGDKE